MSEISVRVSARTDIGMQRAGNEDAFLVSDLTTGNIGLGPEVALHRVGERGSLMVVSDGMGGAAAGEIASEMAVKTVQESLMSMPLDSPVEERLIAAAQLANESIWNHAQQNPELSGMGATLTAVLVQGATAYVAQVGDSRAYLIRGGEIKQITKDQSLAQMLVDAGAVEPDQMDSIPQNVIMQALGTQPSVKTVMTAVELCRSDYLVLCSDGLSNKVKPDELRDVILQSEDMNAACRRLVEMANERGGEDNITVITARFDGESLHTASEGAPLADSFKALNQDYILERIAAASNKQEAITAPLGSGGEQPGAEAQEGKTGEARTQTLPPLAPPEAMLPETPLPQSLGVTTPLETPMAAIQASYGPVAADDDTPAQGTAPAEASAPAEATAPAKTTASVEAAAPSAEPVLRAAPEAAAVRPKRQSYTAILIIALISLILLAAAAYFAYTYYFKPVPVEPTPIDVGQAVHERAGPVTF